MPAIMNYTWLGVRFGGILSTFSRGFLDAITSPGNSLIL